jgi:hypothetical protein
MNCPRCDGKLVEYKTTQKSMYKDKVYLYPRIIKHCAQCVSQWRKDNPEKAKEHSTRAQQVKAKVIRVTKEKPCLDCCFEYPSYVMDFDHVRGLKVFNIGQDYSRMSMAQLKEEIQKCEVVCSNCHRIRTHKRKEKANGTI